MTIQKFIEKAIDGGWKPYAHHFFDPDDPTMVPPQPLAVRMDVEEDYECEYGTMFELQFEDNWEEHSRLGFMLSEIWLDPLAWQAVGKSLGNKDEMRCNMPNCDNPQCEYAGYWDWKRKMVGLMEAIVYSEMTIEQYLESL